MKEKLSPNPLYLRLKDALQVTTDREMAKRLRVTPQSVNGWKRTGKVSRDKIKSVSELMGVSLAWLLTGEGEKFPANNTARTEQTVGLARERQGQVVLIASVVPLISLPVVGLLKNNQLQPTTERTTMELPQNLVSATALVIQISDESFASEGFHKGDALIVEDASGQDCEGKMVVAEWEGRAIIRRLVRNNGFCRFPASNGQPEFSVPSNDIKLCYVVKSVIHDQA